MNRDFYRLKNTLMFSFLWTNNFLLTWEVYNIIIKLLNRFNLYCLYSFKYCRINIPYLSIYLNSVGGNMFSICLIEKHKKRSFPLRISSLMENLIFCTVTVFLQFLIFLIFYMPLHNFIFSILVCVSFLKTQKQFLENMQFMFQKHATATSTTQSSEG